MSMASTYDMGQESFKEVSYNDLDPNMPDEKLRKALREDKIYQGFLSDEKWDEAERRINELRQECGTSPLIYAK